MHKPTTKPSTRIAARAERQRPTKLGTLRKMLRNTLLDAVNAVDHADELERSAVRIVGVDSMLLIQHQRGEIAVLRNMLRWCRSTISESLLDGALGHETTKEARHMIEKIDEATLTQMLSELLTGTPK